MVKNKKQNYDIAIIGAGASGLMAAITAARDGRNVVVLEHKHRIGKKIPATGNGKCNYTNEFMDITCFRGNQDMAARILSLFDKNSTIDFFRELGIYPKCKNGYYYPNSEQAASILQALEMELIRLKISVYTDMEITSLEQQRDDFVIRAKQCCIRAKKVIFATGLKASPKLGSDGTAFSLIKDLGHHFTPIVPALCGFEAKGCNFKRISGVRAEGKITVYIEQEEVTADQGEIQLADYGISGIPVFQVSRYASLGLYYKKKVQAVIDFLPNMTEQELKKELQNRIHHFRDTRTISQMLNGLFNQKLADEMLRMCKLSPEAHMKGADSDCIEMLTETIKWFTIELIRPRAFEFAQICSGGIRSEELHIDTLESKLVPGIYFCGELLDVDGICGGYNLQWAWSSGYAAAKSAGKNIG